MVVGGGSTKRSSVRFVDEKEGSKFWLGVEQRLEASNKLYRPELEERRGGPGLSQIDWMGGSSLIPFPPSFASFHFSHFSLPPFVLAAKSTLAAPLFLGSISVGTTRSTAVLSLSLFPVEIPIFLTSINLLEQDCKLGISIRP